jgi:hypothetical protein
MIFLEADEPCTDAYEHQAYVMALCLHEIGSESDAEKVVTTILRAEFGFQGPRWSESEFVTRSRALAADVYRFVRESNESATTGVYAVR